MAPRHITCGRYAAAVAAALAGCFLLAGYGSALPAPTSAPASMPTTLVLGGLQQVSGQDARTYLGAVTGTRAHRSGATTLTCDGFTGRVPERLRARRTGFRMPVY